MTEHLAQSHPYFQNEWNAWMQKYQAIYLETDAMSLSALRIQ